MEKCTDYSIQLYLVFFFLLAMPRSMWDLISPARDQTCAPCSVSAES